MEGRRQRAKTPDLHRANFDSLDDACLVRVFGFLTPMPDRFSAARVCKRWQALVGDRRMWLRVEATPHPASAIWRDTFSTLQEAVSAARPGDTILVAAGAPHSVAAVVIDKPLCLLGSGETEDETVLLCPRGVDGALVFLANARVANLSVRAELGCCLLHKSGRLEVENCALECVEHPLEHLVCPIVTTAPAFGTPKVGSGRFLSEPPRFLQQPSSPLPKPLDTARPKEHIILNAAPPPPSAYPLQDPPPRLVHHLPGPLSSAAESPPSLCAAVPLKGAPVLLPEGPRGAERLFPPAPAPAPAGFAGWQAEQLTSSNRVRVVETRIEGGERAVRTSGGLSLQQVRVMYTRAALFFWFTVAHPQKTQGFLVEADNSQATF